MAALTPTQARELELTRRGLGSFDDFSKYLESQRTVPVDTGLTAMDGSPLEGRGLDFSAEGISRGLAPARRAIGRGVLNPLAALQDLIAVPASTAEALISKGLGGVSSALGATDIGQFFLDQGDKGFDRASSKLAEAIGPGQVVKPLDGNLSPADMALMEQAREQGQGQIDIFSRIPDPSSNVDAAARLMMEQSQSKGDANREAILTTPSKSASKTEDPMSDYSGEEPTVDLFMEAMADGNVAQGKEQPKAESREDLLEKYKQEFSEATGIDISGKPDTSQALMAMGLSLMQNRAGKGFNVGKILRAVGESGEKAMPYVAKAASEAKAATAAAGKYALQKITNNENAEKAVAAATLKAQRDFSLELMKLDNAREVAAINSSGKANKIENVSKLQPLGKDGGVTFNIGNVRGESKFANAAADVGSVTRAWDKYSRGQSILQEMKTSLDKIESADSTALDGIYESVISSLDKLGISDSRKVFEEGVGPRASFNINRQSMINGFKRLLLQESQVSDLDLRTMTASFGNADIWSSIPASQMAIDNMMVYFGGKKKTLEHPLTIFSDRDFYTSDAEFDKVMKHLEKQGIGGFGGVSNGASIPTASNVDGVSTVRLG